MNKRDLVTLAALMGTLGSNEPYGSLKNPYYTPAMKCKESKPLRYVYGWLATINPGKVTESAREAVIRYRRECYEVLYEHFTGSMRHTIDTNNAEIELLKEINTAIADEKETKNRKKKAEASLAKLRTERLNPQPTLFY